MKPNRIGLHKFICLVFTLMLTALIAACGGTAAEEPAATAVDELSSVAQQPAEEADDHSEDEEHEEDEDHSEDGETREHGPHEHGAATLTVAWSGNDMEIELDTPAFNLFGFEYEPATGEDIQTVQDSVRDLESGNLLRLNEEAECSLVEAQVNTAWEDPDEHEGEGEHEGEAEHDEDEAGEAHSDVLARFRLVCESPEEIQSVDLAPFFERFPNFEELDAQWVSDTGQSSAELTADAALLSFR